MKLQRRIYRCAECHCTHEVYGTKQACDTEMRGLLWMYSKKQWYCQRHRPFSSRDKAPLFIAEWERLGTDATPFIPNYPFNLPDKHQFDVAFPSHKVAVEVNGGRFKAMGGRHMSDDDMDKLNVAQVRGWTVLSFSPQQIENNPLRCIELVKLALAWDSQYIPYLRIGAME